ncbi:MAG: ATP-dependent DNA helicase RecG [Candidatus Promineifilaceae bacterium]|jgi:ATP-dependent DNA helicase RecG
MLSSKIMKPLKNRKPGQQLAFLPYPDIEPLAETMLAFANNSGGLIVLGLDFYGNLTNDVFPEDAEVALHEAMVLTRPPVECSWQEIPTPDGNLIGFRVNRSRDLHSMEDGRILTRTGTDNRPLTADEIIQLAGDRTYGDFEEGVVAGATVQTDFDNDLIAEYMSKREERGASWVGSRMELLFEIGAITNDGLPTVAGMLMFGRNPQAYFPQCGAVFVRFDHEDPRSGDGGAGYGRRDEIRGPLSRVVEQLWNTVWGEMRTGAVVNGLERTELTEYPNFAVREAIINAVCHRDYRIKGRRIEVRMYADRLEIISPGGLPGYMTLANLVEEHFSRNPRIVNGLFYWGYIEELGLGIDRMIEEMVELGHEPPSFKDTGYSFTVSLSAKSAGVQKTIQPRWTKSMNERQARALTYIRENGSITNREYARVCDGVSAETLRRDLAELVNRGALLKIGSKKGTHYILK